MRERPRRTVEYGWGLVLFLTAVGVGVTILLALAVKWLSGWPTIQEFFQ